MTSGIGGTGGPSGPGSPIGPGGVDDRTVAGAETVGSGTVEAPAPGAGDPVAQLAADLDAGRLTPEQAMARLVDDSIAGLPPDEQSELKQLMEDLIASDPYLGGLLGADPLGGR